VVDLGFPFETITSASVRASCMADVLRFFLKPPRFDWIALQADNRVMLTLRGEPGRTYAVERSADLQSWSFWTNALNPTGLVELFDSPAANGAPRFYRASLPP
jgi:hypothetical protein